MCGVGTLTNCIVADYCNYCNRHQERTMPETVFFILENKQAKQEELHGTKKRLTPMSLRECSSKLVNGDFSEAFYRPPPG